MKIVFATNNQNKLKEIKAACPQLEILSLNDIGFSGVIPETQDTIEGNAIQKAEFIYDKYQLPCFADDTGLLVTALEGKPGVYSARYAGEHCSSEDNMAKLLHELSGFMDRTAEFKTVIALINDSGTYTFEGSVDGEILTEKSGNEGFGYDPIFKPIGFQCSFAEMTTEEKNAISHRGKAVKKLIEYLGGNG